MEDINNLQNEQADFIFEQGKIKLESAIKSTEFLERKIFFFITVLIGFSIFFIKIFFNTINQPDQKIYMTITVIILLIGFLIALYKLIKAIYTRQFFSVGNHPQKLLDPEYSSYGYKYLVICEALSYDKRIDHTNKINKEKGLLINQSLCIIFYSFILSIFIPLLFHLAQQEWVLVLVKKVFYHN